MKHCPNCNTEVSEEAGFCPECGFSFLTVQKAEEPVADPAPAEETPAPQADGEPSAEEAPALFAEEEGEEPAPELKAEEESEEEEAPEDKKNMLATWQFFLLEALFAIPVIGTVFLFIWAVGHPKNESLRRFASSVLIWRLLFYVLVFAAVAVMLLTFKDWAPRVSQYMSRLFPAA